jgi:phage shock protein C
MQATQPPLWARDHTLFGVCEGLGEDFGFNPLFLRVPLAVLLLVNPVAVFAAYGAGAVLVVASRWLIPNPRPAVPATVAAPAEVEPEMALAA